MLVYDTKTITILSNQFGENNPKVAIALNNLAVISTKQLKFEEAEVMRLKALKILQACHGEVVLYFLHCNIPMI